jgi:hypothetical protein
VLLISFIDDIILILLGGNINFMGFLQEWFTNYPFIAYLVCSFGAVALIMFLLFRKWLTKLFEPMNDKYESWVKIAVAFVLSAGLSIFCWFIFDKGFGVACDLVWFLVGGTFGGLIGLGVEYSNKGKSAQEIKEKLSDAHDTVKGWINSAEAIGLKKETAEKTLKEVGDTVEKGFTDIYARREEKKKK